MKKVMVYENKHYTQLGWKYDLTICSKLFFNLMNHESEYRLSMVKWHLYLYSL